MLPFKWSVISLLDCIISPKIWHHSLKMFLCPFQPLKSHFLKFLKMTNVWKNPMVPPLICFFPMEKVMFFRHFYQAFVQIQKKITFFANQNFIFWGEKRVVSTKNGVTWLFWRFKYHFLANHTHIRKLLRKWTFSTTKNAITWNGK